MELLHEKQEFHFYMNCVPLYNEVFTFDINTYRPLTSKVTHSVWVETIALIPCVIGKLSKIYIFTNLKLSYFASYQNNPSNVANSQTVHHSLLKTCSRRKSIIKHCFFKSFLTVFHFYAFLTTGLGNLPVSIIVSSILSNPSGSRI